MEYVSYLETIDNSLSILSMPLYIAWGQIILEQDRFFHRLVVNMSYIMAECNGGIKKHKNKQTTKKNKNRNWRNHECGSEKQKEWQSSLICLLEK